LEDARDKLLDRSLRNKLINTGLTSERAKQIRVFGASSDVIFQRLRGGRVAAFAARGDEEPNPSEPADAVDEDAGRPETDPRRRETKLQTRLTADGLKKRLTELFYESQTIEEEQGVSVLFLALGFLEWREAKASDVARYAPLILLPVDLTREAGRDRFKLKLRPDDMFANVSLQAWLKAQFGIALPDLPEGEDWLAAPYFDQIARAIGPRRGWRVHPDEMVLGFFSFSKFLMWRDLDPANWSDPTLLSENALLKTILLRGDGDDQPDSPLVGEDERIDEVFKPADLVHVTDADSSQALAIQEAMAGKNLVIQGPPGTGKSQTITNIIAGAVKRGKRVLFIAEKMAALDVVHQRLVDRKLGAICLELHSRKASKAQVIEQIKQARSAPAPPAWPIGVLSELEDLQHQLRAHSDGMHAVGPDGLSAFDLLGRMSLVKSRGAPAPTFSLPAAADWTVDQVETARRRAAYLGAAIAEAGPPREHPWRGAGIRSPDRLGQERLRPLIAGLGTAGAALAAVASDAESALSATSPPSLGTLTLWAAALAHLAERPVLADALLGSDRLLPLLEPLLATADDAATLVDIRARLAGQVRPDAATVDWSAARRVVAGEGRSLLRLFSRRYREAIADLRGVWLGPLPKDHDVRLRALGDLIEEAQLAGRMRDAGAILGAALGAFWLGDRTDWSLLRRVHAWLVASENFDGAVRLRAPERLMAPDRAMALSSALRQALTNARAALGAVAHAVDLDLATAFDGRDKDSVTIDDLQDLARRCGDRFTDIVQWPPIGQGLQWLREIGGDVLADQAFQARIPADQIEDVLLLAAYETKWTQARHRNPELERIAGDELNALVARFRAADIDRIALAADEVARAHLDKQPTGSAGAVGIVNDEIRKARNLKPVRKLMEEAGEAVQRFKPVFLMSPLSVAQYLAPGRVKFDLLVIDEASQVRPEDALGAIARCGQVVVVGDDKQLPPTSFFNRMINDDEETFEDEDEDLPAGAPRRAALKDIESILNLCSRFPERMLRWHYRSEHPSLIAISNRNFYRNQLLLPPSVLAAATDGDTGLVFHKVAEGGYDRGKTARNELEAEQVAQAVLHHARTSPHLSLGIGAFSVAQRDCIRDRIDRLRGQHPELDAFVKGSPASGATAPSGAQSQDRREPVFVKNLENIQGDERDVIFISVGYGKDRDGRFIQSFGPVGADGGERRLNVLITRARKRCEVFSSIVAEDIRLDGVGRPGIAALKEFLKLAKDGFVETAETTGRGFDSDFEESVAFDIRALGYQVRPQVGMAGFFIDIGVIDPRDPDRYLLGVECDGAAYHSSRYARDRDRLRQMVLERRGWKMHRIWSTDWFYRHDREVAKLKDAIETALAGRPLPNAAHIYDNDAVSAEEPSAEDNAANDLAGAAATEAIDRPERRFAGLPPYVYADFEPLNGREIEPHRLSDSQLAEVVTKIVAIEHPIHTSEVGRRLAQLCGKQRAGDRIQVAAARGLALARQQGRIDRQGDFWRLDLTTPVTARNRSGLASGDLVRKLDLIDEAELAAAARVALEQNLALGPEEWVTETARLLGFARLGKDVALAIETAIHRRLEGHIERDHLDRWKLKTG
jgi:very-short-patch-repair endonuclease